MKNRKEIRKTMIAKRESLPAKIQKDNSKLVFTRVINTKIYKESRRISAYQSFRGEVDSSDIVEQILSTHNKECYLPVVDYDAKKLLFVRYKSGSLLKRSKYGILEPDPSSAEIIPANKLDLAITPLVAFSKNGYRLGYGSGFYDRTFAFKKDKHAAKPFLLGIGHQLQLTKELEPSPTDIPMDMIITENGIVYEENKQD